MEQSKQQQALSDAGLNGRLEDQINKTTNAQTR